MDGIVILTYLIIRFTENNIFKLLKRSQIRETLNVDVHHLDDDNDDADHHHHSCCYCFIYLYYYDNRDTQLKLHWYHGINSHSSLKHLYVENSW